MNDRTIERLSWSGIAAMFAVAIGAMILGLTCHPKEALCSACIGQFCGNSAECPSGCFCAKEGPSYPTGRCLGD